MLCEGVTTSTSTGYLGANFGNGISQRATLHRQVPHPPSVPLHTLRESLSEGPQMGSLLLTPQGKYIMFNEHVKIIKLV